MMPAMIGYVALGSNLGDRAGHLRAGLRAIAGAGVAVSAISSVWETEPVGPAGPGLFLNMAARIESERTPEDLLAILLDVERERGRVRRTEHGPRELDCDLLLLGDFVRSGTRLTLPHPRMWGRRFVLAPLAEIAPALVRRETGRTVADELASLDDPHAVRRVGPLYTREVPPVYSRAL